MAGCTGVTGNEKLKTVPLSDVPPRHRGQDRGNGNNHEKLNQSDTMVDISEISVRSASQAKMVKVKFHLGRKSHVTAKARDACRLSRGTDGCLLLRLVDMFGRR
jgi:hypothetical protein